MLGIVDNLGVHGQTLHVLKIYVGLLAATILFVATNAGVIGASRITYSMATYRQIPEVFRHLHPKFKTPWLAIVIFAGIAPICVILPGSVTFVGTLYSFGATLSFTVAHASIVALRRKGDPDLLYKARPNLRLRGVDWPVFALLGGIATGISFFVIVVQNPTTRWVGLDLARHRLRRLRGLPEALRPRAAAGDREGAADDGPGDGARIPDDPVAGRRQPAVA